MSSPKEYHINAVYPEPLSRLRRGPPLSTTSCSESSSSSLSSYRRAVRKQTRRGHAGGAGRFRTQPVTFHEIKEVDEENLTETDDTPKTVGAASKSESDLKAKFELFYRSIGANTSNSSKPGSSNQNQNALSQETSASEDLDEPSTTNSINVNSSSTSRGLSTTLNLNEALSKSLYIQKASSTKPSSTNSCDKFNPKSRPSL